MSVRRLPPVLCLHLKRFEQLHGQNARKLEAPVRFPTTLDMEPYTSHAILARRHGLKAGLLGAAGAGGDEAAALPAPAAARLGSGGLSAVHSADSLSEADTEGGPAGRRRTRAARSTPAAGRTPAKAAAAEDAAAAAPSPPPPLHELFGVISHRGSMRGGHYVAFVKARGEWYRCDDAYITRMDEAAVLAAQAYMLFYAQHEYYPRR